MRLKTTTLLTAVVALLTALQPGTATAQTLKGEAGSTSTIATVIAQATAKSLGDEEVKLTLNTDQTLTRSSLKLAAGKIDVSIVPPNAYNAMSKGVGPYKENPDQAKELSKNVRSLYSFVSGTFHPIVWADSGIESWEDIKDKRVFLGPPGGSAGKLLGALIEVASGYKPDQEYEAIKMGWGAGLSSFQDGQFDVMMLPGVLGSAAVTQLGLVRPIRMLSMSEEQLSSDAYQAFLKSNASVPGVIPANTYKGQVNADEEIRSASIIMTVSVHKDLSDDTAYALTKAFWENVEDHAAANVMLQAMIGADPFIGNPIPLHPGAAKYFAEKGVEVPAELVAD